MNVFDKHIPLTSIPSAAESSLVDVAPASPACQAEAGSIMTRCGLKVPAPDVGPQAGSESKYVFDIAASEEERREVFAFRYNVYAEKMGRPDIGDADHEKKVIEDSLDDSGCHFTVKYEGVIVGALRIHRIRAANPDQPFDKEERDHYKLDPFMAASPDGVAFSSRLIIDPDHRHGHVLNKLLSKSYETGLNNGIDFVFVHVSPSLVELYERLAYRRYAENVVDPVFGFKVPMVLVMRDETYMKSIRSPFRRVLGKFPQSPGEHPSVEWFNRFHRQGVADTLARRDHQSNFWKCLLSNLQLDEADPASLLKGLSGDEIVQLTREGTVLRVQKGNTVVRENSYGSSMFMVLEGSAIMHLNGNDAVLETYGPGNVFGEIALVTETKRTANVTMAEDGEIFVFTHSHLQRLIKTAPELAAKVLLNISGILGTRLISATHDAYAA